METRPTSPVIPRLSDRIQYRVAKAMGSLPTGAKKRLTRDFDAPAEGGEIDPGIALMLKLLKLQGGPSVLIGAPVGELRKLSRAKARIFARPQTPVEAVRALEVDGAEGALKGRHYRPPLPASAVPPPLLVYAHGGGYMVGDLDTHEEVCRLLCRHAGVQVLSVEYRLAPEHPFPAGIDDYVAAVKWAIEHASELGADPEAIVVGGDSAGANFAAVASQRLRGEGGPLPALQLLIYPGTDFVGDHDSLETFGEGLFLVREDIDAAVENYIPEGADKGDPGLSPLRADDFTGLPPAVVITAAFDPLRDEGEAYAQALADAGVRTSHHRFPGLIHGFINLTNVNSASRDATIMIAGMVRGGLARSQA